MRPSHPDFLAEAQGVSKAYPGVLAVDQVSLTLQSGEIHGIVGENGAGKTTLMKILAGLTQPDEGRLMVKGEPATFGSPGDAIQAGIGMVQQHFTLVPTMTVAENIALAEGQLESGKRRGLLPLDFWQMETKVQRLSDTYHLAVSPAGRIEDFSVGVQQRVELLRTLYLSTEVLILDEPTAVLTPSEIRGLMKTLRKLTADGRGIFFVSHHLQEVLDFTDRISVMRGGRLIDTVKSSEASKSLLARMMIGRLVSGPEQVGEERKPSSDGTVKLEVRDLWVRGEKKTYAVEGVSVQVRSGEVLGVAGIDGNGQEELAAAIAGLRKAAHGSIYLKSEDVTQASVKALQGKGLSYVPPDRQLEGVVLGFDVAHNLILRCFDRPPFSGWGILNPEAIRQHADRTMSAFDIRAADSYQTLVTLSGGNQQKVVLARELQDKPDVLVSCYATRGLDVAAVASVQREILAARAQGAAVLYFSNEIEELLEISDRIAVMNKGKVVGVVDPDLTTEEEIGLLMGGN